MTKTKMNQDQDSEVFDQTFIDTLKDNPNLFQENPELLELIKFSDSRGTSSLLEKQVELLKGRLRKFQNQQMELIDVARENEKISDTFSPILAQLIGFRNLSEFAAEFPAALRASFDIDEVSIKTTQAVSKRSDENSAYQDVLRRLVNQKSVCDNRWPSDIMKLFFSASMQSAALIPLKVASNSSEVIGVIGLGSKNADKYLIELGTAHLDHLGLMAGICLARLQPTSV